MATPITPDNENAMIFPQNDRDGNATGFRGALTFDNITYDVELVHQDGKDGKPSYYQITGKPREGESTVSGAVFESTSSNDRAPALNGPITFNARRPDEIQKRISLWHRTSKATGNPFLSGNISDNRKPDQA